MSRETYLNLPDRLCRLAGAELALAASDAELVQRFCDRGEAAAFELIIRRHGPLVWDVCRNLLGVHDAEDAFQATFLVLARKADSIRKHESLASWLYGVAYRVSIRARAGRYRRRDKEREGAAMPRSTSRNEESDCEERTLLHEELHRLPDRYRRVIVLCHLQGLSCEQAAAQIGCRTGTVKSRLSRGREALRQRLIRRGVAAPAAATLTAADAAPAAALPIPLITPTAEAAALLARGETVAGLLSAPVLALADAVLRSMALGRPLLLLASLTVLGLTGVGAILASVPNPEAVPEPPPARAARAEPDPLPVEFAFPAIRRDGAIVAPIPTLQLGVRTFWQGPQPGPIAFSPDGKLLASGGTGPVRIMNAQTGQNDFPLDDFAGRAVGTVAFSPDGRYLAVAAFGSVALYPTGNLIPDPRKWNQRRLGRPEPEAASITNAGFVGFSPDSRFVALPDVDHSIVLFEVASGKEHRRLRGHEGTVWAGEFAPDGRTLATAGADRTIRIWDVPAGTERHRLTGHRDTVRALAFDKDGVRLATGGLDQSLILWDVATGLKEREIRGDKGGILALVFDPNEGSLVSAASDRTVRFWDAATGVEKGRPAKSSGAVRDLAFTPEGLLAVADGTVRFRHPGSGVEQRLHEKALNAVVAAAFSSDGGILATTDGSKEVRLWDRATGRDLGRLHGRHGPVALLEFAPDRDVLFTTGGSGVVTAWDLARGVARELYRGHDGAIGAIAISADGRSLASAGNGAVHLWESATGRLRLRMETGPGFRCLAFTPDGEALAVGSADGAVRLWDLRGRVAPRPLLKLPGPVEMIAFSPDGRLLTGGADVRLWEPATGKPLRLYADARPPFALNADGTTLAARALLNPTQLYDVSSAAPLRAYGIQSGAIRVLAFAPDGQSLVSAGDDSTLVIWNDPELYRVRTISPVELAALGDDLLGGNGLKASRARMRLLASPEQAVALVRQLLMPARVGGPALENCLRDMNHQDALRRDRAAAELHRLRLFNQPGLRHIAENHEDLNLRSRAVEVLRRQRVGVTRQDQIVLRAPLDVLAAVNNPEATAMLEEMARGEPDLWLTREARRTLQRLKTPLDGSRTD